jgi:hypothetical protein
MERVAELSGPESDRIRQLEDQMARLLVTVESLDQQRADCEQQRADYEQRVNELQARVEHQQAEMADLRTSSPAQRRRASGTHRAGRGASRRTLLRWGGAAAAAAAVTLVASEQAAHAAPNTDGGNVVLGNANTAEHPTVVKYDGTAGNAKIILLANDSTLIPSGAAYPAALGGWVDGTGTSGNANGVYGYSGVNHGYGVVGSSTLGPGVYAQTSDTTNIPASPALSATNFGTGDGINATGANDAVGVFGHVGGTLGVGVVGTGFSGVVGTSDIGYGVVGATISGIDVQVGGTSGTGRLQQRLQGSAGAPTTGTHGAGEQIRDSLGDLYICTVAGTPGTWKKVAAIPAGTLGGATVFLHAPFRIFDTRPGVAGCPIDPGVPMASGAVTTLQVTGTPSTIDSSLVVPSGATGIIGDLLAINVNGNGISGAGAGFLTLQPHSVTPTGNSYLHYYPSTVQHNCVVMGLDASGKLDVGNYNTATNVGLDITGYII